MCTSLAPEIGYDNAAKVAKGAFAEGTTVREYALKHKLVEPRKLDQLLDPWSMTEPGGEGAGGG
jgi:fumarate hydratase class II